MKDVRCKAPQATIESAMIGTRYQQAQRPRRGYQPQEHLKDVATSRREPPGGKTVQIPSIGRTIDHSITAMRRQAVPGRSGRNPWLRHQRPIMPCKNSSENGRACGTTHALTWCLSASARPKPATMSKVTEWSPARTMPPSWCRFGPHAPTFASWSMNTASASTARCSASHSSGRGKKAASPAVARASSYTGWMPASSLKLGSASWPLGSAWPDAPQADWKTRRSKAH